MVTWGDLRRWNAAAIGGVADALNQRCTTLIALNDDVEGAVKLEGWFGDAAAAATTRGNSLVSGLEQRVAEASAARTRCRSPSSGSPRWSPTPRTSRR
jgi:hypothetical protein